MYMCLLQWTNSEEGVAKQLERMEASGSLLFPKEE